MNRIVSANLLACTLMTVQLAAALFFSLFGERLNPLFTSVSGLLFINQAVIIFIPVAVFAFIVCKSTKVPVTAFFRLNPLSSKNIILIVLMAVVIQPLMSVLSYFTSFFFTNDISDLAMDMLSHVSYGEMVFLMALLPSIFEEAAMRGAVLSSYGGKLGIKSTILINGLLFGMMHLNGHQFLYAAVLGAFFAYLVYKTNSIFASVIAHFTINFSQTTLIAIISAYMANPEYSQLIEQNSSENIVELGGYIVAIAAVIFYIAGSLIVFIHLIRKFKSINTDLPPDINAEDNTVCDSSSNGNKSFFSAVWFYLSFLLVIAVFFIYMIMTGLSLQQLAFLLFIFVVFFLILFFLRLRS